MRLPRLALLLMLLVASPLTARAQVGPLIWSDEFNSLGNWLKITGNGNWGWGNGELECYRNENADIGDVPGEAGNKALRIIARNQSGPGIVDQYGNPLNYTSARLITKSFVTVKYGMIEARVSVPNLAVGGWPAFWMLGNANLNWPYCGEVDLMEMGAGKAFRNLHDSHNGGNGLHNSNENQMVGSNAIWNSTSGTASLANDPTDTFDRPYYSYSPALTNRFLLYRCYWDSLSMRFTVVDNGVEYDLYTHPFVFGSDAGAFRKPFYLLTNLAIGGAYTDAQQLYNPSAGVPVSMPMPDTMYVDYVRVYQWNGQGAVALGPPPAQDGRFGLFSDTTPMSASLVPNVSEDIYVWSNTLVGGTIPPYEGANGLSWKTNSQGWFGAGLMSREFTNLFAFGDGTIKFRIKMPANVSFKIGLIDTWGNQNYVDFPAYTTKYGLVRDGNWGQAAIPVADIRGTAIDLRMLSYEFVILEVNGTACEFGLDDIYWERAKVAGVDAPPARAELHLSSAPNPFRSSSEMRFELPAAGPYVLEVVDVSGERVRSFRGTGVAGANTLRWDGRRADGRVASPGVYWYRLAAQGHQDQRKVVLLQ